MACSSVGEGKIQHEPGTSCDARKKGSAQKMMEVHWMDIGVNSKELPMPKAGTIWSIKQIMTAMDYNV